MDVTLFSFVFSLFNLVTIYKLYSCNQVVKLSNNKTKNKPAQFSLAFNILTLTWIENVSLKVSISFMLV